MSDGMTLVQHEDGTFSTYNDAYDIVIHCESKEEQEKAIEHLKSTSWIPVSEMPNCCGYPVLLTVENKFGQREVCKAFTNYMKEGKQLFYTNEKEYCAELTSSKLSEAWRPIAWMHLPEPYKEG
jgi:hypothetical protein